MFSDVVESVEKKKYILEKSGLKFTNWDCNVDHSVTSLSSDSEQSFGFSVATLVIIAAIVGFATGALGYIAGQNSVPPTQAQPQSVEMSSNGSDNTLSNSQYP